MQHAPLLRDGMHSMTLDEVFDVCVASFPENQRRAYLFERLTAFLAHIHSFGIEPAEIWIDGSFLTKKPEPNDIDLLFILHMGQIDSLPEETKRKVFGQFQGEDFKIRYQCDLHLAPSTENDRIRYFRETFRNLSAADKYHKKGIVLLSYQ